MQLILKIENYAYFEPNFVIKKYYIPRSHDFSDFGLLLSTMTDCDSIVISLIVQ